MRKLLLLCDGTATTEMASMGLSFLSLSGVVDISQPFIHRLPQTTP